MQKYEYLVVTADGKSQRVVADNIKGVLAAIDEDETPVINIFRNVSISEGDVHEAATVCAKVFPQVAYDTGCRTYPVLPVLTRQGKFITLSCQKANGWKFDGWYCENDFISKDVQATVAVADKGEVIYTARFSPAV